jgi:hypothetical protein
MDGRNGSRGSGHDWWDKIKQAQQGNRGATQGKTQALPSLGVLLPLNQVSGALYLGV